MSAVGRAPFVIELAPATTYRRIRPLHVNSQVFEDSYRNVFEARWSAAEQSVPSIRGYHMQDAVVDLDGIVIDPDGRVLEETIAECDVSGWTAPRRVEREIAGPALLLKKAGFANYGHWLIEMLPRVQFRGPLAPGRDLPVLIHRYEGVMRERVYESLALAGIGPESVIEFEPPVRVRDLYWISPISKHNHMKSPAIASFLAGIGDKVATAGGGPGNRLFVSRSRCSIRRVTNEDELFAIAEAHGFRRVYTEDMTLAEQIRLFRSAEAVVGPLGAAMTNIVFAPGETRVLVLQPAKSLEFFFWDIACHRGQPYVSVHGPSVGDTPLEHYHGDFTVDPGDFRAGLEKLLPEAARFSMTKNLAPCFWGPVDQEKFVDDVRRLIAPFGEVGAYAGDNLITFGRNLGFLRDEAFLEAFGSIIHPTNTVGYAILWRLYMFSWAAKSGLKREGDFVECGVSTGSSSAIMCRYLNFASVNKTLYLYDTWGMDPRVDGSKYGFSDGTFREVTQRFAPYPNVRLVPGFVPETFHEAAPEKIAFLHIDMNEAEPEIAVLDHLFDRVVPGGIVLFDDYGSNGYAASKAAEDEWTAKRGYSIAELPTGQGLLIK